MKDDNNINNVEQPTNNKGVEALRSISKATNKNDKATEKKTINPANSSTEKAFSSPLHLPSEVTLQAVLGGDLLFPKVVRRQVGVFILITCFIIVYIGLRYNNQQKLIEVDKLNKELKDAKYKALSSTSLLTEKSRESNVLEMLKNTNDSVIKIANQPPYIITVPEE